MPAHVEHERMFAKSAALSSFQMPKTIQPIEVIRVLNRAKISFVLAGAYGLAGWKKESRATEDVDVLVAVRQLKKAVKALLETFPLEAIDLPVVIRLRDPTTHDVLIDVMKPLQQPYLEVFKHTHSVTSEGETYRVPSLEMATVMKFSAMTSPYRADEDKFRDAHDFIKIVKANPGINETELGKLASLVYADAGKDIQQMVQRIRAGEKLII